jgi:hypothetical protein
VLTHRRGLVINMNGYCPCIDGAHMNLLVSCCGRAWSAYCKRLLTAKMIKLRVDSLDIIGPPAQAVKILVDILHDLFNIASNSVSRERASNSHLAVQMRLILDDI